MTRARKLLTTALAAAALLGAISFASAASLPLGGGVLTSLAVNHPCPGNATAVPSAAAGAQFTGVTVSLLSADCSGRTVQVTVLNGATVVAQGQATVSGATATVTGLTGYSAQAGYTVQATVGGWSFLTIWTYTPPPIEPGNPQTVIQSITWSISNQNQACATVTVTTDPPQSKWLVNLNVAQPPFYGAISGYQITENQIEFVPLSGTPVDGVLGIQGSNNGSGSQGPSRTFTVCH